MKTLNKQTAYMLVLLKNDYYVCHDETEYEMVCRDTKWDYGVIHIKQPKYWIDENNLLNVEGHITHYFWVVDTFSENGSKYNYDEDKLEIRIERKYLFFGERKIIMRARCYEVKKYTIKTSTFKLIFQSNKCTSQN